MDIAHPGWEQAYIAQADAYCAGPGLTPNEVIYLRTRDQAPNQAYVAPLRNSVGYGFAPTRPIPHFTKPAGQAMSPTTSPFMAGLLGAAIGGAIGYFAGKR